MKKRTPARRRSATAAFGPWGVWADLWQAQAETALAAAEVVARRSALMLQGALTAEEATRMILEKQTAFAEAAEAGARRLAAGASVGAALTSAGHPIRTAARANARRLRR